MIRSMTSLSLTLVLCLLASVSLAQEKDWKQALQGKWQCDSDKTAKLMTESGVPDEQIEMAKQIMGDMKMEITTENMIMFAMGQETKTDYTIEDSNEEKKWIKFKVTVPLQSEPRDVEFTLKGADMFEVKLDERTSMIFNRIKKDEKSDG